MQRQDLPDPNDEWYLRNEEALHRFLDRSLELSCPDVIPLLTKGQSILDLGCGPGGITVDLARRVFPGKITGVDLSPLAIKTAIGFVANQACDLHIKHLVADGNDLPFDHEQFDGVVCINSISLLHNRLIGLRKIRNVVKRGGWIFFNSTDGAQNKILFPCCPTVLHCESLLNPQSSEARYFGRQSFDYLRRAGFVDCRVTVATPPEHYQYSGQSYGYDMITGFRDMLGMNGVSNPRIKLLIDSGNLSKDDLAKAQKEIDAFQGHPNSYYAQITFNAWGFRKL